MYRIDVTINGIRKTLPGRWRTLRAAMRNYCRIFKINRKAILVQEKPYKEIIFTY